LWIHPVIIASVNKFYVYDATQNLILYHTTEYKY